MVLQAMMLHWKAILGWGQAGLMRWILVWIISEVQDWLLGLLTCSPVCYPCVMTASTDTKKNLISILALSYTEICEHSVITNSKIHVICIYN